MNHSNAGRTFDEVKWIEDQLTRYGPIIGGEALRIFLGFRTYAAFQKARRHSELEIAVFGLPGRQGHFAMTAEACAWLVDQRKAAEAVSSPQNSTVLRENDQERLP